MSLHDQVLRARTPRDAIIILADAIQALREDIQNIERADPWESWGEPEPASEQAAIEQAHEAAELRAILERGGLTTEEEQAISAQLRLIEEQGGVAAPVVAEGRRERVTVTDDAVVVELPTPSPERQEDRRRLAVGLGFHQFIDLPEAETVRAFTLGGPLWLYHYDRDAVMNMPIEWRMALVDDIAIDSPATAQEVGRDILKYTQADGTRDAAYEAHLNRGDQ